MCGCSSVCVQILTQSGHITHACTIYMCLHVINVSCLHACGSKLLHITISCSILLQPCSLKAPCTHTTVKNRAIVDNLMKNVGEQQSYLSGAVLGWFVCCCSPLMWSIDLPLLTCSPRPMAAPAGGVISLISVMEGSKGL